MAITFPRLNPILFKEEPVSVFEQSSRMYYQKWNKKDYIIFQVNYDKNYFTKGEIIAKLVDAQGAECAVCLNDIIELPYTYQSIFRLSCNIADGIYRIKLTTAGGKFSYYSNYFDIGDHVNTMLIQYTCRRNNFDCIFVTNEYLYSFFLRVEGDIKTSDINYQSDDVFYTSQDRIMYLVDSIPFVTRKYTFGDSYGLPVWIADRLNRIFACDITDIDGARVIKNDGAKLEATSSDAYPYLGLKIELLRQLEGYSEMLREDNEVMKSGLSLELVNKENSYSVLGEKTGRIHINTFTNEFD